MPGSVGGTGVDLSPVGESGTGGGPAGIAVAVSFSVGEARCEPACGLAACAAPAKAGVVRETAMARVTAARIRIISLGIPLWRRWPFLPHFLTSRKRRA